MVIGELQDISAMSVIKAMKVQDLSGDAVAKKLWPLEIQDLHSNNVQ